MRFVSSIIIALVISLVLFLVSSSAKPSATKTESGISCRPGKFLRFFLAFGLSIFTFFMANSLSSRLTPLHFLAGAVIFGLILANLYYWTLMVSASPNELATNSLLTRQKKIDLLHPFEAFIHPENGSLLIFQEGKKIEVGTYFDGYEDLKLWIEAVKLNDVKTT